jgi:phage recombination protein Bet
MHVPELRRRWQQRFRREEIARDMKRQGFTAAERRRALRHMERNEAMESALPVRAEKSTELARRGFTPEEVETIKTSLMPNATDEQLKLFVARCRQSGLNPLKSPPEIWAVPFRKNAGTKDNPRWVTDYVAVASIDGLRIAAYRSRQVTGFRGCTSPEWCGPDGRWRDVWLEDAPPAACRVGVWIEGIPEPVYAIASWREYEHIRQKARQDSPWFAMPAHMLAIAAERQALRKACPNIGGIAVEELGPPQEAESPDISGVAVEDAGHPESTDHPEEPEDAPDETGEASGDAEPGSQFPPADEAAAREVLQNDLRQALLERGISGPAAMKWLADRFQGKTRASALTLSELAEAVKMVTEEAPVASKQ